MCKEVFLDDNQIERMENVWRNLNHAVKDSNNPLLIADRPWEGYLALQPGTVLRDPERNRYLMWYNTQATRERPNVDGFLCLAVSTDGITWTKPELGQVEFDGSRRNNILMRQVDWTHTVLFDADDVNPERRFKMAWWGGGANNAKGICVAFSADGICWQPHAANPVVPRWASGDTFGVTREHDTGRFLLFHKTPRQPIRTVSRLESDDFIVWRNSRLVLAPDAHDPPDTEFYGLSPFRYAGQYAGLLWVYHTYLQTVDIQLVSSRDGLRWERVANRKLAARLEPTNRREDNAFDCRMMYPASELITVNGEDRMYYSGFSVPHNAQSYLHDGKIGMACFRRDGLCSLDAVGRGTLLTKPFVADGGRLAINAKTATIPEPVRREEAVWRDVFDGARNGAGTVRVEIRSADNSPLPGYRLDDCIPVSDDGPALNVRWKAQNDMNALLGKRVRLSFELVNAKLFGWQTVANE